MTTGPRYSEAYLKYPTLEQSLLGYIDYAPSLSQFDTLQPGFLEFAPADVHPYASRNTQRSMNQKRESSQGHTMTDPPFPRGASSSSDSTARASSTVSGRSTPIPLSPRTPDTSPPNLVAPAIRPSTSPSNTLPNPDPLWVEDGGPNHASIRSRNGSHANERPHTLKHKPDVSELRRASESSQIEEWNPQQMRNVTVRKTRTDSSEIHRQQALSDLATPAITHDSSSKPQISSLRRSSADVGDKRSVTALSLQASPRTPDMQRFSLGSSPSTVVKANIVITPSARQPTLRKVSKNESLRSEASRNSNRNSLTSDEASSPLSASPHTFDRRYRYSLESDTSSGNSMPHILRRKKENSHLRRSMTPEDPSLFQSEQHEAMPQVPEELRSLQYDSSLYSRFGSHHSRNISSESGQEMPGAYPPEALGLFIPTNTSAVSVATSAITSAEVFHDAASHVSPRPSMETFRATPVSTHGPRSTDHVPRFDFETPTGRRISMNPSLTRSDYSREESYRFSPVSVRSDATLTYEVKEAAAVNIFAHNNNSLLMVHHSGSYDLLRQHTSSSTQKALKQDFGFVAGSSPDLISEDDLTLENPRAAPVPPVVTIIPPTPAKELDQQESDNESRQDSPVSLHRRQSLLQRARRYSDTFIQPLTISLRRRKNEQLSRAASARRPPSLSTQEGNNLHPFWRPRGLWNDLSDSEDEGDDLILSGPGASSSSGAKPPPKWRRRGSVPGFLIGNSLGLERGPTNRRRPRIDLPSKSSTASGNAKPVTVRDSARWSAKTTAPRSRSSSISRRIQIWREKVQGRRNKKKNEEDTAREERRENLRHQIRTRISGNEPVINWAQNSVPGQQGYLGDTENENGGINYARS